MRIAQLAPLYEAVPPHRYGGTERVVAGLTEALVGRGHEVVLFASGDSVTSAELVACCPRGLRLDAKVEDPIAHHIVQLGKLVERAGEFDVIHNHIDYLAFPVAAAMRLPVVTTLHGRLDLPDLQPVYAQYVGAPLVSISNAQRPPLSDARWLATVYNGIDLSHFTLREESGQYLAFLGRVSPEKGLADAILIARAVNLPLRIAAKIDPVDREYFDRSIEPMLASPGIEYVGEIDEAQKNEFLGYASAYLFPIRWPEPFGITMVESMACGTPVIALAHGAVPEVVVQGHTGFVCQSLPEMVEAVHSVGRISRRACRAHVERQFTVAKMAAAYEAIYGRVVSEHNASDNAARAAAPTSSRALTASEHPWPGPPAAAPGGPNTPPV